MLIKCGEEDGEQGEGKAEWIRTRESEKIADKVNKDFNKARRQPCHVHAEIQLVDDFKNRREETGRRAHPYIEGRKLSSYLCDDQFVNHKRN